MTGSYFVIKWPFATYNTFAYGSQIRFDKSYVHFSNPQMSPGSKIQTWRSKTDYHNSKRVMDLPLLNPGKEYEIIADLKQKPVDSIHIQLDFFSVDNQSIGRIVLDKLDSKFEVPQGMYSYELSLINLNNEQLDFNYFLIKSVDNKCHVSVYNKYVKTVVLRDSEEEIKQVDVLIRNRVLSSGTYVSRDGVLKIYLEVNSLAVLDDKEIEDAITNIVHEINPIVHNRLLLNQTIPFDIKLMQLPDSMTLNIRERLVTALSNLED